MRAEWVRRLRGATKNKYCQLPSALTFAGGERELVIELSEKAAVANMQQDGAAFEAWALAFLAHDEADTVRIIPPSLSDQPDPKTARHLQRLRYRLETFASLYPDRVSVDWPPGSGGAFSFAEPLLLNQPTDPRPELRPHVERMAWLASLPRHRESDLEFALETSPALRHHFRLDKVMRQWPVGLFRKRVAGDSHVFTGGKSAVDLIGLRGSTLMLFELKKEGNAKAGILSELLFYTSVLRDALGAAPRWTFESRRPAAGCAITVGDILACDRLEAVLLAPQHHPVVTGRVVDTLNAATALRWVDRPARFSKATFAIQDDDFQFAGESSLAW